MATEFERKEEMKDVSIDSGDEERENRFRASFEENSNDHKLIRPKKKAKRPSKAVAATNGLSTSAPLMNGERYMNGGVTSAPRNLKNSRRSRSGYGRGLPKKNGGGGKGVWGKPGSELKGVPIDEKDPNFDESDSDCADVELRPVLPEMTQEEVQKMLEPLLLEYLQHGDTCEVMESVTECNLGTLRYLVPTFAVELAMDHKPSHREMISVLLSDLCDEIFSQKDLAKAFDNLLNNLPDLLLDIPEAATLLGNFIARAVADDCLPPSFVQGYKGKVENDPARSCLTHADNLLTMKHGLMRLDTVWGVSGGIRPVKALIRQMNLLLNEYLSSCDIKEAIRCLKELDVPHFHHELVYEATVLTLEKMSEQVEERTVRLLKSLSDAIIVTPDQLDNGFLRVFEDMPDISLDVPTAYADLDSFILRCQKAGFVSNKVMLKLPARGRKRFVSEGDGGLIKQ